MNIKLSNMIDESILRNRLVLQKIFPYHKSVTGDGIDSAFDDLKQETNCNIYEFKTGTDILGWEVPKSWNVINYA